MNEIFSRYVIHPRTATELQLALLGNSPSVTPMKSGDSETESSWTLRTLDIQYKSLTAVADVESHHKSII